MTTQQDHQAGIPEALLNRPDIEGFEKLVKLATPGVWGFQGVIWDYTSPPEFDCPVESDRCGEHSDEVNGVDWMMQITSCAEERRTWAGAEGQPITGQTIFTVEPMPTLVRVVKDVNGENQRVMLSCVKFARPADAALVRMGRTALAKVVGWVRHLEHYVTTIVNENESLRKQLADAEAELALYKGFHEQDGE